MHAEVLNPAPEHADAFCRWFGQSQAVDASGKPLVLYHGSAAQREQFRKGLGDNRGENLFPAAFFFTPDRAIAQAYGPAVTEVFVRIERPYIARTAKEFALLEVDDAEALLTSRGHDGAILYMHSGGAPEYVAFGPEQIKSVNNRGTYDPQDPRIAFKKAGVQPSLAWLGQPQLASAEQVGEAVSVQDDNHAFGDPGHAPAEELCWLFVEGYPVDRLRDLPDQRWWEEERAHSGGRWSELETQDVVLPVVVMDDGHAGYVWDGYHRATATALRGRATLPAIVGVRPELLAEAFPEMSMEQAQCIPRF